MSINLLTCMSTEFSLYSEQLSDFPFVFCNFAIDKLTALIESEPKISHTVILFSRSPEESEHTHNPVRPLAILTFLMAVSVLFDKSLRIITTL